MGRSIQINTCSLDSFEGLHQAIQGTRVEVTQLGRGRFRGSLSHVGIGDFSLSIGSFSVGVRAAARCRPTTSSSSACSSNASERVTHWSFDMVPADVLVMPPSTEHDGSFHGAAAYAAIRLDLAEVTSLFNGDPEIERSRDLVPEKPLSGGCADGLGRDAAIEADRLLPGATAGRHARRSG